MHGSRPSTAAAFTAWLMLVPACSAGPATADPRVNVHVDAPGIYGVSLKEVTDAAARSGLAGPAVDDFRSTHCGRALPTRRISGAAGERLVFLVPSEHFEAPCRRDGSPTTVVQVSVPANAPEAAPTGDPEPGEIPNVERIERRQRFERDLARAPLDLGAAEAGVESAWYWSMISHQASSRLDVDLGDLGDRAIEDPGLLITVDLLGWSDPKLPGGIDAHQVDLLLNGERIGGGAWDGRASHRLEISAPASPLRSGVNRLTLKIPRRVLPPRPGVSQEGGEEKEIVDLVYVDRVDLRYRVDRPVAGGSAPLVVPASGETRRLPDAGASAEAFAVSPTLGFLSRDSRGWILPGSLPSVSELELWIVEPGDLRAPLAVEPTTGGARQLPSELDYLVIAPRSLIGGAERLAAFHRGRGLRSAVVDATAVYDAFGDGEKRPRAVRRFLAHQLGVSPDLRYVLLVGDADWLVTEAASRHLDPPANRDLVPTVVHPSSYGPAASDHYYAVDPENEASPRFAVGRLPVVEPEELEAVVDKLLAHGATPPAGVETLLMLSDRTEPSLRRREKLAARITDAGFELSRPRELPASTLDVAVLEALERSPAVVHFGGHGSRFQWQLGASQVSGSEDYFDREDVARSMLSPRLPVVLSISCATAPFDHPTADSLGEVMVLTPGRGAVAFIGAGARLHTPRRFSEELVRALAREATVGDALVAAKRATARPHVSYLYNLLGDPAMPLR